MTLLRTDWTTRPFTLRRLDAEVVHGARASFGRLPPDAYVTEGWRQRRLTRYRIGADHELTPLPPGDVWQTRVHNKRFGDLPRRFEPLEESWTDTAAFQRLVDTFCAALPEDVRDWTLWVHQIRVVADGRGGQPTPEGPHRDERIYVGIAVMGLEGVAAGATRILASPTGPVLFEADLAVGDLLVFHDEVVWHDTQAFRSPPGTAGHRDVVLLAVTRTAEAGTPAERTAPSP
jgi:hypothetical protein